MKKQIKFLKRIKGVTIISPKNTFIEFGAKIGEGTVIYPNNYIKSGTAIGRDCTLYPNNFIQNATIGDRCKIGPFAHIREKTTLGNDVRFGNFCEIKASFVGDSSKISHLSYIGDGEIGEKCNIGCGVIFANFNGKIKQKTIVGNNCFVGCNSNLIAPLKVGDNCFISAGTTISHDLESGKFVVPNREINIKNNREIKLKNASNKLKKY